MSLDSSTNLDYERPEEANRDGVYEVAIRAANAAGFMELDVTLTVLDVNELHTLAGPSGVSFPSGGADVVATFSVTHPDASESAYFYWRPSHNNDTHNKSFNFNTYTGGLTFKLPPDYDAKRTYVVVITADQRASSSYGEVTLRVTITIEADTSSSGRATGLTAVSTTHDAVSPSRNAPSDRGTVTGYQILRRNLGSGASA